MGDAVFRSDIRVTVNPEACCGSDLGVCYAAWAIPPADPFAWDAVKEAKERHGKDASPAGRKRLVGACAKYGHNTPFEHGLMGVYAEAPGVVWWQLTRQRFMSLNTEDFSFNLESGRYKHLDPEFYIPPPHRPCAEPDGFKPMRPELTADLNAQQCLAYAVRKVCRDAWDEYGELVAAGVAREVARLVLPNWALYCDGYVTARPLSWLQFFAKRNKTPETAVATFPQWEIEEFARQCEALFAARWPATHEAFVENGRRAP